MIRPDCFRVESQHMNIHLYKVSQNVLLAERAGINLKQAATYKIVATLPVRGSELQYRVKGEHERFERVVEESQITATVPLAVAGDPEPKAARGPARRGGSSHPLRRGASR